MSNLQTKSLGLLGLLVVLILAIGGIYLYSNPQDVERSTYQDTRYGFELSYPKGSCYLEGVNPNFGVNERYIDFQQNCPPRLDQPAGVQNFYLDFGITLSEDTRNLETVIKDKNRYDDNYVSPEATTVSGNYPAYHLKCLSLPPAKDGEMPVTCEDQWFVKLNNTLLLTIVGPDASNAMRDFKIL